MAEVARVERVNEEALNDARQEARREIAAHLEERWRHHLVNERQVTNLEELRNDIDMLCNSRSWGLNVWAERGADIQRATEAATRVEELTEERDAAATVRDAATAAEADMRAQAVARGQELENTVEYLRGAVTTLDAAEDMLNIAVENGTAGTAVARLTEERDAAVRARVATETERTAYRNRVQRTNQELVTARQSETQADSRRIRADTAAQEAQRHLATARAERAAAMTRRDALEEAVAELTRERDAAVEESACVQAVRDHLDEAHEDVERLTRTINELHQANETQVERLYTQQSALDGNIRVNDGLQDTRAYNLLGTTFMHHAQNALNAVAEYACLSDVATARAQAAASVSRRESDAVDAMRFRRCMARERRARLIEQQRAAGRRRVLPPPIVAPVPKGSRVARQDKRILAALGHFEDLSELEDSEDSEDDVPITQILGRIGRPPPGGEGGGEGGDGGAAAV